MREKAAETLLQKKIIMTKNFLKVIKTSNLRFRKSYALQEKNRAKKTTSRLITVLLNKANRKKKNRGYRSLK